MINIDEIRQRLDLLADDELVSILRERDEEQWRPEVFDLVASILKARGVSPAAHSCDAEEIVDEAGIEVNPENLVTIGQYLNAVDANIDRNALEGGGIKSWIFDEFAPQMQGIYAGVRLQVRAEDMGAAMHILQSGAVPSSDLPPEIAEPPCPRCGSREVTESPETVSVADLSGIASSPAEEAVWFYHCASCSYKWTA